MTNQNHAICGVANWDSAGVRTRPSLLNSLCTRHHSEEKVSTMYEVRSTPKVGTVG